tara:strand:+ start:2491 stop:2988 length:498 start_codon:yes stop_codon:yes gene_type:complete
MYFTPRDDIKSYLIDCIKQERKSIYAAIYMLTDKSIAQALLEAHLRGVDVVLVLDHVSMSERFGKGSFLQNNGVPVFVHHAANYNPFTMPIMHHKFFIFGLHEKYKKSLVWTGSFNCTVSASKYNDENVIVSDDAGLIKDYKYCFDTLVERLGGKKDWIAIFEEK